MTDLEKLLEPAWGYFQLGMYQEANDEIENLPPVVKTAKGVLGLRARIYQELGAWELLREVGGFLVGQWPDETQHWVWLACGVCRSNSPDEVDKFLAEALRRHDTAPVILFSLACAAAQRGDMESARGYLTRAIELDPGLRLRALDEPGLEPLWASLGK